MESNCRSEQKFKAMNHQSDFMKVNVLQTTMENAKAKGLNIRQRRVHERYFDVLWYHHFDVFFR